MISSHGGCSAGDERDCEMRFQYRWSKLLGQPLDGDLNKDSHLARRRKERRQQHGSDWLWKQTDAWYYTILLTRCGRKLLSIISARNGDSIIKTHYGPRWECRAKRKRKSVKQLNKCEQCSPFNKYHSARKRNVFITFSTPFSWQRKNYTSS
jgi:hypothetical protein